MRYTCKFDFCGTEAYAYSDDGIYDFTEGFWLSKELRLTKGSDAHYWIPACRIFYIEKSDQ